MDCYGRLPSDVINEITKLYNVLDVNIEDNGNQQILLILKTLHYQCKIKIITPLRNINGIEYCDSAVLEKIKILINNRIGSYTMNYPHDFFEIIITKKDITISTAEVDMTLPIMHIDNFIAGLQKLYTILHTYPKY